MLGALLVLLAGGGSAAAQEAGDRVRVAVASGARVTGRLERMGADTLVMMGRDSVLRAIPLAHVRRLDVARGRASRTRSVLRGAAIGLGVGAVVGGAVGALAYEDECGANDSGFCLDFGREFGFYLGGVMGGGVGMLAGGTAGAVRDPTRWVSVPGDSRVRLGARRDGGVALAFAIPLR